MKINGLNVFIIICCVLTGYCIVSTQSRVYEYKNERNNILGSLNRVANAFEEYNIKRFPKGEWWAINIDRCYPVYGVLRGNYYLRYDLLVVIFGE